MVRQKVEYMVVTNDDLELPVMIGSSVEVAAYLGIRVDSLYCLAGRLSRGERDGSNSKYKVEKFNITEEDEE